MNLQRLLGKQHEGYFSGMKIGHLGLNSSQNTVVLFFNVLINKFLFLGFLRLLAP